ncbi:MAG TPA: hypothetical protein ENK16_08090 [Chromatiales bacterium]|nr:hypothetical protein [Chromatiales bacterium]
MQFNLDTTTGLSIRSYSPGQLRLGEQEFTSPVILTSTQLIITDWAAPVIDELQLDDLRPALNEQPELILLGTGEQHRFPPARMIAEILRQGIGFECMNTRAACRTFNVLVSEGRQVAAALIV